MRLGRISLPSKLFVVAALINFASHVQASLYYVDPKSCSAQQAGFIRAALSGATDMANIGRTAAHNPTPTQRDLIMWLFGDLDRGQQAIKRVFSTITGAARFTTESEDGVLQEHDMKFYCDQERFKRRWKGGLYEVYDSDVQAVQVGGVDVEFEGGIPKDRCIVHLAYTAHPVGKHWQIQLCPWFIKYATEQEIKYTGSLPAAIWAAFWKRMTPTVTKWVYAPIDAASVFDKVMLHELTHAVASEDVATLDVGGWEGYGWKNCRKLSTQREDVSKDPPVWGPESNADTFALYGSASLMISQGHTVNIDGTFRINEPEPSMTITGALTRPTDQRVFGGSRESESFKNVTGFL